MRYLEEVGGAACHRDRGTTPSMNRAGHRHRRGFVRFFSSRQSAAKFLHNSETHSPVDLLFDKSFLFNWTPNPARPGVVDATVFFLKETVLGVMFVLVFAAFGYPLIGFLIWGAAIEEQGMVTWMKNADSPIRAAVFFRTALVLTEHVMLALPAGAFESLDNAIAHLEGRALPIALHVGMLMFGCMLMLRQVSLFRIWLTCALCHVSYNSAVASIF